jgi:hypothetical protein
VITLLLRRSHTVAMASAIARSANRYGRPERGAMRAAVGNEGGRGRIAVHASEIVPDDPEVVARRVRENVSAALGWPLSF